MPDANDPTDNNYTEQAIRPSIFCQKNYVLIEASHGACASAMLNSLVKTARANLLNVYHYLEILLKEIPQHMNDKDLHFLDDLLPWSPRTQEECPSQYKKS